MLRLNIIVVAPEWGWPKANEKLKRLTLIPAAIENPLRNERLYVLMSVRVL